MYITNVTDDVRKLFESLDKADDYNRLNFLLYTFNSLNNNQINNKNEVNPNLVEDDDLIVFNFNNIGYSNEVCDIFVHYIVMVNNIISNNKVYIDCGNVIGLNYNNRIISSFEKLNFIDKIDVISELIIRYDNKIYFNEQLEVVSFDSELSGYDIAYLITKYKERISYDKNE